MTFSLLTKKVAMSGLILTGAIGTAGLVRCALLPM